MLALAWPDGHLENFRGEVHGSVTFPPRGTLGFGHDPIFQPEGMSESFGELDSERRMRVTIARPVRQLAETCLPCSGSVKLTFVNHACCKLIAGDIGLLFDPWIDGSAFNQGWDLLIPTPLSLDAIMAGITQIWLSHEHPDHFSPSFSRGSRRLIKDCVSRFCFSRRAIIVRLAQFCGDLGFRASEMENSVPLALGRGVTVTCGPHYFYDFWLHVTDGKQWVINLNDCQIAASADLTARRLVVGSANLDAQPIQLARRGKAARTIASSAKKQRIRSAFFDGADANLLSCNTRCLSPVSSISRMSRTPISMTR